MDLHPSAEDEAFRAEVREWLETELSGDFASVRGTGGPGSEHEAVEERLAWERRLGESGWSCVGWPEEYGGRGASLTQQVAWTEEYARARAPGRVNIVGEGLLGPTVIAFGSDEQRRRFLPPIVRGEEIWCQGYSEPDAGSDLGNIQTKARLDGDGWVVDGQKVWTSLAHVADWCFVLCRTDPSAPKHKGISYLLVPMDQPGIEIRPIVQLTGTSEFNEVFFESARTDADLVVGDVNDGWRVAMGTLGFERGTSTFGQQLAFQDEFEEICGLARKTGAIDDPVLRDRLADTWISLRIMRLNSMRTITGDTPGPEASIVKLFWSSFHQRLGELAMDVLGAAATVAEDLPYELGPLQRSFLFSRADTIYAGSSEIQRNIIGERALGLPREPVAP